MDEVETLESDLFDCEEKAKNDAQIMENYRLRIAQLESQVAKAAQTLAASRSCSEHITDCDTDYASTEDFAVCWRKWLESEER